MSKPHVPKIFLFFLIFSALLVNELALSEQRFIDLNHETSSTIYFTETYDTKFDLSDSKLVFQDDHERALYSWFSDLSTTVSILKNSADLQSTKNDRLKGIYTRYISSAFIGTLSVADVKAKVVVDVPSLKIPYDSESDKVLGFEYQLSGPTDLGEVRTVFFYQRYGIPEWQVVESKLDNLFSSDEENCLVREVVDTTVKLIACDTTENSKDN